MLRVPAFFARVLAFFLRVLAFFLCLLAFVAGLLVSFVGLLVFFTRLLALFNKELPRFFAFDGAFFAGAPPFFFARAGAGADDRPLRRSFRCGNYRSSSRRRGPASWTRQAARGGRPDRCPCVHACGGPGAISTPPGDVVAAPAAPPVHADASSAWWAAPARAWTATRRRPRS